MRSCPPACRRAVQHPRLIPPETIWISDDVLSGAFQRFVSLSKCSRRHGSFVPGPLEARRRVGKRRMGVQLSESTPKSAYYFPPMWNIFGEVDRTRFKWEPPSTRSSTAEVGTGWLGNLKNELGRLLPSTSAATSFVPAVKDLVEDLVEAPPPTVWKPIEISTFRSQLRWAVHTGNDDRIISLCNKFNGELKRSLILGLVPDEILLWALNIHRYEFADIPLRESLTLTFCKELWDGITSSKVMSVSMLDTNVLNTLIGLLSELPICPKVQTLAHSILCSSSRVQLQFTKESVIHLIHAWIQSWAIDECPSAADMSGLSIKAEEAVDLVKYTLSHAHSFLPSLEQSGKHEEWIEMNRLVTAARDGIHRSIEAVDVAENILSPQRTSVALLAAALHSLEEHGIMFSSMLVQSCSNHVSTVNKTASKEVRTVLRFYWLSLVAQMRNVYDGLFIQILQALNDPERPIRQRAICLIMIDRWTTQGALKSPVVVRNAFEARGIAHDDAIADLLQNLKINNEAWWAKTEEIFALLRTIGASKRIHKILTAMLQRELKLPTSIILRAVNNISYYNAQFAYNIFHIWLLLRDDRRGLHMEKCPDFVLSLIASTRFSSKAIWDVVGLPLYYQLPASQFPGFSGDPKDRLWPTSEALITKMAVGFAAQAGRRPRFALRNVSQCLLYLRIRGNPITPTLTKSLVLSGITMEMVRGCWIDEKRLAWSLKMIEQGEGTAVAEAVDKQVFNYRKQLVMERETLRGQSLSLSVHDQQKMVQRQHLLNEREEIRLKSEMVKENRPVSRKEQQERRKQERERLKRERLEERERLKQATLERQRQERERLDKDNERRQKTLEKLAKEKRKIRDNMESTMKEIEEHVEKKRASKEPPKIKKQPQWGRLPIGEEHVEKKLARKEPPKIKKQPQWGRLPIGENVNRH